jgi:hypothetical protein
LRRICGGTPITAGESANRPSQNSGARGIRTPDPHTARVIRGLLARIRESTACRIVHVDRPIPYTSVKCVFARGRESKDTAGSRGTGVREMSQLPGAIAVIPETLTPPQPLFWTAPAPCGRAPRQRRSGRRIEIQVVDRGVGSKSR